MAKQITLNVEVDRKTKQAVSAVAKERKVSSSDVVRWALDSYLASYERAKSLVETKEQVSA